MSLSQSDTDTDDAVPKKTMIAAKLTQGSISKSLFHMAVPMAAGILATMSFNIVDTLFVAKLGEDSLAALSFTFPVVLMVISLSVGLGAGTSSVVALAAGEHDEEGVKALTTDSFTLSVIITMVLGAIGLLTIAPLFRTLGATEEILPLIDAYMVPWYISVVFLVPPMVGLSAVRALGNTKLQANFMLAMALGNLILDPLLIYGWWGFPRMEIQGAAMASLIVRVVSMAALLYYLHVSLRLFVNPFKWHRVIASWKKILHVGVPAMATNMIIPVSGGAVIALVAMNGPEAVAGFGVASRVESMALILFYALSAVIGPFCGQNLGAQNSQRLFASQKITAIFCLISGVAIALVLALFGRVIARWFSVDPQVIEATYIYLLLVPISYSAYGVVMVVNASFNGLGRPMPGVVISVARVIVILLPLAWLGNGLFGLWGVFAGIAASNIIVGVGAYVWINATIKDLSLRFPRA